MKPTRSPFVVHKGRPESEIVREALTDPNAKEELKWYMDLFCQRIAKRYTKRYSIPLDELAAVGLTYFDRAFGAYAQRHREQIKAGKKPYKFSTYFTWWIRESIRTYLGIAKAPLEGIDQLE